MGRSAAARGSIGSWAVDRRDVEDGSSASSGLAELPLMSVVTKSCWAARALWRRDPLAGPLVRAA
jgi:hypothetical protein